MRVHSTAEVRDSVLMPGVVIGAGARVRRAILDENVQVMPGTRIGFGNADSRDSLYTANGVCVIPANTIMTAKTRGTRDFGRRLHQEQAALSAERAGV